MWFENVVGGTNFAALDRVIRFTESRHKVLANNIANIDTPDYKMRDLDVQSFQRDLTKALESRTAGACGSCASSVDDDQYLLFHDGNNRSVEKQMAAITENAVLHNTAVELLRSRFTILEKAIALRP